MAIGHNSRRGGSSGGRPRLSALLHAPDLRIAVVLLIVCAALFAVTTTFDSVPEFLNQNIPATWFPRVMLVVIALLTLVLPVEHHFLKSGKAELDEDRRARIEPISTLTAALLILVVLGATVLGTLVSMMVVCLLLPLLWGERLSWKVPAYAVGFPLVVWFVFTKLLQVYFDAGLVGRLME